MKVSVVIPIYNEEENIRILYQKLISSLNKLGLSYEIIFVDDGSKDKSLEILKDIQKGEILSQENIKIIRPAVGIHPRYFEDILGKRARFDLKKGNPLQWSDFE